MPKKKLYGNRQDPRCETCAFGKPSADGSSVLCRRGGVLPKFHSCKHYQYDPLKRVPPRQKAMNEFEPADFTLDDWVEENIVVEEAAALATGSSSNEDALQKLRAYLDDAVNPDVNGIMAILSEITGEEALEELGEQLDTEDALPAIDEEEATPAQELPAEEVADIEEASVEETPAEEIAGVEEAPAEEAVADEVPAEEEAAVVDETVAAGDPEVAHWTPDNSLDIEADLKTIEADLSSASAKAAFSGLSMQLLDPVEYDEEEIGDEEEPEGDPTMLMFDPLIDEDDEDVLAANTLIFLSDEDLSDATIETLSMNEDGSLSISTEEL